MNCGQPKASSNMQLGHVSEPVLSHNYIKCLDEDTESMFTQSKVK